MGAWVNLFEFVNQKSKKYQYRSDSGQGKMDRDVPHWFKMKDRYILKYLEETGVAFTPTQLHHNMVERGDFDVSESTIKRRLWKLRDSGLVEYSDESRGFYKISEKGRAVLEF